METQYEKRSKKSHYEGSLTQDITSDSLQTQLIY